MSIFCGGNSPYHKVLPQVLLVEKHTTTVSEEEEHPQRHKNTDCQGDSSDKKQALLTYLENNRHRIT